MFCNFNWLSVICIFAQYFHSIAYTRQVPQCEVIKSSSTKRSKKIQREGPRKEQKDCEEQPAEIAQHDIAQVTPEKKAEGIPVDTPPKEVLNTKFGGQIHAKQTHCRVCQHERDDNMRGASCNFCLLGCRQALGHQRIADVLSDPDVLAEVRAKSLQLRPLKVVKRSCHCRCQEMAGLVKKMESLANLIPHLEKIVTSLGQDNVTCPQKRKRQ